MNHLGTSGSIQADGVHRAGMQAPGFRTLGAGIGNLAPGFMKIENLDTRFRGIENSMVLIRAGHFALQAACTFVRADVE
jgi:hypothetical protein